MSTAVLIVLLVAYGLVFGSFFNVVGIRVLKKEPLAYPPSHCVSCDHRLHARDLVPVFSYLALRGRCRYCRARISPVYPLGEAATAAGWAAVGLKLGFAPELAAGLLLVSVMVIVSITDLREMLIPDAITYPAAGLALLLRLFVHPQPLYVYLLGGLAGAGALLLLGALGALLLRKESMGGGDVKLLGFAGLLLGWKLALLAIFLSSLIALVVLAIFRLVRPGQQRETEPIPFGPFLAAGSFTAYLWGESLITWYMHLLVP